MVRRTCTAIAVLAQADTQLSPIGVTWGSAALGPCSLRIGSQELTVRHGPIVPRCPGNGPQTPSLQEAKRRNTTGTCEESNPGGALPTGLCPTPIAPTQTPLKPRRHPRRPGTGPTSAPTSAARPLIHYLEVLERTRRPIQSSRLNGHISPPFVFANHRGSTTLFPSASRL